MVKLLLLLLISINATGQGLLDGFKVLNIPRETIPLGAEWIDGVGVNGSGEPETNIVTNKSLNSVEVDKEFKENLDLSILSYFNLGAGFLSNVKIRYINLTIHTVKDISKTSLSSGQLIVYECIKADSIYLKVDKQIDASLKLQLDEKIKNLKLESGTDFSKGVIFSGEKLFFAYRVFELGKTTVTSKSARIKDTKDGGGLREVEVMEYQLSFNDYNLQNCMFPQGKSMKYDETTWLNCERTAPINVVISNFNKTNVNGKPHIQNMDIYNSTRSAIYFTERLNNKLITDYIEITFMIKDPKPLFFFYIDDKSKVVVRRMETSLKIFRNPKASGW